MYQASNDALKRASSTAPLLAALIPIVASRTLDEQATSLREVIPGKNDVAADLLSLRADYKVHAMVMVQPDARFMQQLCADAALDKEYKVMSKLSAAVTDNTFT